MSVPKSNGGGVIVESVVQFGVGRRGRKSSTGAATGSATGVAPVPRIARTMALAIVMDEMLRAGVVEDCAELARIAGVTRARVSQVMSLVSLAPQFIEEILFGADSEAHLGTERVVRRLASTVDWGEQVQLARADVQQRSDIRCKVGKI